MQKYKPLGGLYHWKENWLYVKILMESWTKGKRGIEKGTQALTGLCASIFE